METVRLAFPLLQTAQAQKEITHNEALIRLDFLLGGAAQSADVADPPVEPQPGQGWIVAAGATGAWAGQDERIAFWDAGGWRFVVPVEGVRLWLLDRQVEARYGTGAWQIGQVQAARIQIGGADVLGEQQPAIGDPAGGSVVDAQARAALSALLEALRAHGLIAS